MNAVRSQLNWTQYRLLSRIEDTDKKAFYIAESIKNHWTSRQLERQINSLLYERLLMSNDKESVLAVANGEKQVSEAKEIIKDPMFLEFWDSNGKVVITKKSWNKLSLHTYRSFCYKWITVSHLWLDKNVSY